MKNDEKLIHRLNSSTNFDLKVCIIKKEEIKSEQRTYVALFY